MFQKKQGLPGFLAVFLCALLFVASPGFERIPFVGVNEAHAQERQKSFLELLFQRRNQRTEAPKAPRVIQRSTTSRAKTRRVAPAAPAVPAVEKAENARKVLVVGDFVAGGMAEGLVSAFAEVATVVVESRTNGSSGLVRDDYYDWFSEVGPIIDEVQPSIVVVMLGSNDRQVLRVDGATQEVRSDAWLKEYRARVDGLVGAIRAKNIPVMWVGNPPYRFSSMSADMLALNEIYRQSVGAVGGYFVDIWDGFVDAEGNFVTTGPDIKGQQVRLRASDGINFTKAGKRKLAFYVERQLQPLLGDSATPLLASLPNQNAPLMMLPPLQTEAELDRTNPIAFNDPDLDGGNVLLGDVEALSAVAEDNPLQAKSVRLRLVEDGVPPPTQPGRAGNFTLPSDG